MPPGRRAGIRKGGGAGCPSRAQRGGTRARGGNAHSYRTPRVLDNAALAIIDAEFEDDESTGFPSTDQFLGCPFYKRDPLRHRECMTLRLTSVNYVKQHLHRRHGLPPYCPTCYETFTDSDSCNRHIVNRICCPTCYDKFTDMESCNAHINAQSCNGPPPGVEKPVGVDAAQRSELNKRVSRTLSVQDQWFQVYGILFKDDSFRPASAFVGDPLIEATAIAETVWEKECRSMVTHVISAELSGPDAHVLLAQGVVKVLLARIRSLASQSSSSQDAANDFFSSFTTAFDSQATQNSQTVKIEPSQPDHLAPVPIKSEETPNILVDPNLYEVPGTINNIYNEPPLDNDTPRTHNPDTMTAVSQTVYGPQPEPMVIDSPRPSTHYPWTELAISPSPEPESNKPPSSNKKTNSPESAPSRSSSFDSTMALGSPSYFGPVS